MRTFSVALLFLLTACSTWRPVTLPTPQDSAWTASGRLRLTVPGGGRTRGSMARLTGDTVQLVVGGDAVVASVPRQHPMTLERRTFSGGNTAGLLLLVVAGVYIALGLAIASTF
ncbi:MAG: hypothetical protein ABJB33_08375 [Gemmatimonadota bacterium]